MEIIFNKTKKIIIVILLLFVAFTSSVFAETIYRNDININDKLKFTGPLCAIYRTEETAKNNSIRGLRGFIFPNNEITVQEKKGNILKIGNGKYIKCGKTNQRYFAKVSIQQNASNKINENINKEVNVTSIKLDLSSKDLLLGESFKLSANILPSNATNKNLFWNSSNLNVITVDSTGKVTAVGEGTANITVKSNDGEKIATCRINVTKPVENILVREFKLNHYGATLYVGGEALQLVATFLPENATNTKITWRSSNSNVAIVNSTGKVTAVNVGKAEIYATTSNNITQKLDVTVANKVIKLNHTSVTLEKGQSYNDLKATVSPTCSTKNTKITWKSSNSNVAIVDSTGKITAKAEGTATITASSLNSITSNTFTVRVIPVKVSEVKLKYATGTRYVGLTIDLEYTVYPTNAANKVVYWSSSDTNIATVSSSGVVTAKKQGTATITVKTSDGGKVDTFLLKVIDRPVESVLLDKKSVNLNINEKIALKETISPSNATNKNVTWTSNNINVAAVDSKGNVIGKNPGTAIITVKTNDGGKTANCSIIVKESFTSVAARCKKYLAENNFTYGSSSNPDTNIFNDKNGCIDCSGYVSLVIYEYGRINGISDYKNDFSKLKGGAYTIKNFFDNNADTYQYIGNLASSLNRGNLKEGDILVNPGRHIEIYAKYENNAFRAYTCGSTKAISNNSYTWAVCNGAESQYYIYRIIK